MTIKDLRKKIAESNFAEEINKVEIEINLSHLNYNKNLKGLSSIYSFFLEQKTNWEATQNIPDDFKTSKDFYLNFHNKFFSISNYFDTIENFNYYFTSYKNELLSYLQNYSSLIFPFEVTETKFLLDIFKNNTKEFEGAFNYLTNSNFQIRNDKDYFNGLLLGSEFKEKDKSNRSARVQNDKKELSDLRNAYNKKIVDAEHDLTEHIINTEKNYKTHLEEIDTLKEEKDSEFNTWFENTKNEEWKKWYDEKKETLTRLEKTYETNLKLEKPARYWQTKSTKYFDQAENAQYYLKWIIGISSLFLALILVIAPDYIFEKVFDANPVKIIRWSFVFLTLITLIAFTIKALSKYMFSSYHLARDAEERHTLTFFYLSLLKDTEIKEEERLMILQSLFSRTDTGLLKEDSSPTLPGGIFEKFK
ncbi:DUF6161 domain-containing protein [Flavobacterium sp. 83]|uniref:DUF6161 domain-containing protein n=1 Tax=Flavobacterium sp. 83 TaxID=1131812 RepID=UPI0005596964|nr:DUF6161 domain-containing protein [Flavobacterium sp. 83]